jgi:hypothetical protein
VPQNVFGSSSILYWSLLRLLSNNLIFNLIVGRLRDDLLFHKLIFPLVGTVVRDLLRIRIADPRKCFQLIRRCRSCNQPGYRVLCFALWPSVVLGGGSPRDCGLLLVAPKWLR